MITSFILSNYAHLLPYMLIRLDNLNSSVSKQLTAIKSFFYFNKAQQITVLLH